MAGDVCNMCGGALPNGGVACRDLFNELLALEYSDPGYAAVHLYSVDAYALQHSEDHGPRSNAFHLARLCLLLEHGVPAGIGAPGPGWLVQSIEGERKQSVRHLEPPAQRGALTVADVIGASDADEHARRVEDWARAGWRAWEAHHATVRGWIERRRLD